MLFHASFFEKAQTSLIRCSSGEADKGKGEMGEDREREREGERICWGRGVLFFFVCEKD